VRSETGLGAEPAQPAGGERALVHH
jgi:hypothetical protein